MSAEMQFLVSGLTIGAIYALAALGFTLIYNASGVINFAQGEFIMIGGMLTAVLSGLGLPLWLALVLAVAGAALVGMLLQRLALDRARGAPVVSLVIITIGASIFLRGLAQLLWGKQFRPLPAFSGEQPLHLLGATLVPQTLWVMGVSALLMLALGLFFSRTLSGKAVLATAINAAAARLSGIDTRSVLLACFALSAALGAIGGALIAPITAASYEMGLMLGIKGFVAAVLGGLGVSAGAVVGGLLLGVAETLAAGYLSSAYKDAVAFALIFVVLFFLPNGLFGQRASERV